MNDLNLFLTKARSPHKETRDDAEQILNKGFEELNFSFIDGLIEIIADEGKVKDNRQLACSLLKNGLVKNSIWSVLDQNLKLNLKMKLLSTLGSQIEIVKRSVGVLIASICKIEIPQGNWLDIIDILTSMLNEDKNQLNIISASDTIGFICEDLVGLFFKNSNESAKNLFIQNFSLYTDNILSAVFKFFEGNLNNISAYPSDEKSINSAMKCYLNIIPLAVKNFQTPNEVDFMITFLTSTITQHALVNGKMRILELICQSLIQICEYHYEYIGSIIKGLINFTSIILISKTCSNKVKLFSLEIWCILGDKELELSNIFTNNSERKCQQYFKQHKNKLFELLIEHIGDNVIEDEDQNIVENIGNEWNISKACAYVLSILVQLNDSNLVEKLLVYAEDNYHSRTLKNKYSALIVLSCCLETSHKDKLAHILRYNLRNFIKTLGDKVKLIANTSSWLLCKISELYPLTVDKQMLSTYIPLFMDIIKDGKGSHREDQVEEFDEDLENFETNPDLLLYSKQVRINITIFLINLIKHYGDRFLSKNTNSLTPYYMKLLDMAIHTGFNIDNYADKNYNLSSYAFYLFRSVIEYSSLDFQDYLETILNTLLNLFNKINSDLENNSNYILGTFSPNSKKYSNKMTKEFLFILQETLSMVIEKIYKKIIRKVEKNLSLSLYNEIASSFKVRNEIYENGLTAISQITVSLKEDFAPFLNDYVTNILLYGLNKYSGDSSLTSAAVIAVSSLVCSLTNFMHPYIANILSLLIKILTEGEVNRSLKIVTISCIGDISLNLPREFINYFNLAMELLFSASDLVIAESEKENIDEEEVGFLFDLQKVIVEAWTSINFGIKDVYEQEGSSFNNIINNNAYQQLNTFYAPFVLKIFSFLQKFSQGAIDNCNKYINKVDDYQELLINILALIADITTIFPRQDARDLLNQQFIREILNFLKHSRKPEKFRENLEWSKGVINEIMLDSEY